MPSAKDRIAGALPLVLLLALWQGLAASGAAPAALLPPPSAVLSRLAERAGDPAYLQHVTTTLLRLFAGFLVAAAIGISAGAAAGTSRTVAALVTPLVRVLAPVPKIALYPALILVLGFEHASKIALVAADALFPILLATYEGTRAVDERLVWSVLAAGTSPARALFKVVLPAALPAVLTGCRIGLVISAIVVFLAEMITSTDGLGHLLIYAARSLHTVDMFVPLITMAMLGLLLNAAFNALCARLLAPYPLSA
jgi:ABC-type nitrate/sulfonate/bicarbonate transport system permease component